ncbi:MAG: YnbE family lipoprotein [Croceibacterium sp.]
MTNPRPPAKTYPMGEFRKWTGAMVMLGSLGSGGCVTVKAPDAPIVIELNINIKQEVIYRLSGDAGNTIDENKDIF